jgi:hypothetical protein
MNTCDHDSSYKPSTALLIGETAEKLLNETPSIELKQFTFKRNNPKINFYLISYYLCQGLGGEM